MADVLPINFPLPSESAIASYDFYDLGEGTGIKMFYGASTNAGTYILTQNQIYSDAIELQSTTFNTTSFVKVLDLDFDLTTFNRPMTVRGTAYFNFTWNMRTLATTSDVYGYIVIKVRKYDGSTETEIASYTGDTKTQATGTDTNYLENFAVAITTPAKYGVGDILRVTVEAYGKVAVNAETAAITFGFDPMNRDGTQIVPSTDDPVSITQFKSWIPFKIDL